jgi:hypothetical protein
MTAAECNSPTKFRGNNVTLCLNMTRWREVGLQAPLHVLSRPVMCFRVLTMLSFVGA